ncbi:thiol methyltransferase protein [Rutstroemia sp. NJR-2017a WRK4]|nr:thiol methyltransferase protein [Rutstroemia sp. NJR-2017a WRK4]
MSSKEETPPDVRVHLRAHFESHDPASHGQKWDELWRENFAPWDNGLPNPAFVDVLNEREDLSCKKADGSRKKALVAGCGKGYDVLLLSAMGYDAYGLEISDTALQASRNFAKENDGKGAYATKEGVEKGKITWLSGDFFKDEFLKEVEGENKFDLFYDYTFGCALPPVLRPAWSKRYNELLSPEGRLVCLEFPTTRPPSTGGPPWAMPPRIYEGHLPRPGEVLPYTKEGCELEVEKLGPPHENGLKRIAHFQPRRTTKNGYDDEGKLTDWVGVWSH